MLKIHAIQNIDVAKLLDSLFHGFPKLELRVVVGVYQWDICSGWLGFQSKWSGPTPYQMLKILIVISVKDAINSWHTGFDIETGIENKTV